MKKIFSILALLLCMMTVQGQDYFVSSEAKADSVGKEKIWDCAPEQMPSFPGGIGALKKFLETNIHYPKEAERLGIQGKVICAFVVEKNGSISDVKVTKSVDPQLDGEAVRIIRNMPRWIPGRQDGKPCRVKFTLPVTFNLK